MYTGITAGEILDWYREERLGKEVNLIAADGVHPNKRCYSRWAETMGKHLFAKLAVEEKASSSNLVSTD